MRRRQAVRLEAEKRRDRGIAEGCGLKHVVVGKKGLEWRTRKGKVAARLAADRQAAAHQINPSAGLRVVRSVCAASLHDFEVPLDRLAADDEGKIILPKFAEPAGVVDEELKAEGAPDRQ